MLAFAISTDLRGSTRVIHAAGGRPLAAFDYDPFGDAFAATDTPLAQRISHRYAGQIREPDSGLYDFGARRYDAALARFVSPDPAQQTPSVYAYCANDPINHRDRGGRSFDLIIYFAQERKFRGYLAGNGAYVGVELPELPPDDWIDYAPNPHGGAGARRSYGMWQSLNEYARRVGLGYATRPENLQPRAGRGGGRGRPGNTYNNVGRAELWNTIVSFLKRSPRQLVFEQLPAWVKPLAQAPSVAPDAATIANALDAHVMVRHSAPPITFAEATASEVGSGATLPLPARRPVDGAHSIGPVRHVHATGRDRQRPYPPRLPTSISAEVIVIDDGPEPLDSSGIDALLQASALASEVGESVQVPASAFHAAAIPNAPPVTYAPSNTTSMTQGPSSPEEDLADMPDLEDPPG